MYSWIRTMALATSSAPPLTTKISAVAGSFCARVRKIEFSGVRESKIYTMVKVVFSTKSPLPLRALYH